MTLFQETASAQKPLNASSADMARFQAILAGLVVVLMAVAVTSSIVAGPSTDTTIESNAAGGFAPGYPLHGGLAGPSRVGINDAGGFAPGYPLHGGLAGPSRVGINDAGGFAPGYPLHGGLAGPSRVGINDAGGFAAGSLRSAPQPAEGATDGDNQRFVNVD
jgi:hypothetical protein